MKYENIPETIRHTCLLLGKELEAKNPQGPWKEYILPAGEPNFNRVRQVAVLKEDAEHRPVWWMEGGINWIHFGASTKADALDLYEQLTGKRLDPDCTYSCTGVYEDECGTAGFRLHR